MKICVFGAGAVGGFVAAELASAGHDVSVIARGAHLDAIRNNGITLESGGKTKLAKVRASQKPADIGPQDFVFVAAKGQSMGAVADAIAPLLGPDTPVVAAQNGIPWWFTYKHGGALDGRALAAVDPNGRIAGTIGLQRAIGCVITTASAVTGPGVISHRGGRVFAVGEPDGSETARVQRFSDAMRQAGFDAPVKPRIRDEVWTKLWGNISFSQIALLTGSGLATLAKNPGTAALARRIMEETQAVGEASGARFGGSIDQRIQVTTGIGDHKTSILVDLDSGRPVEIDAQVGAVIEIARILNVPVPTIELIYALVRQRAESAGCYTRGAFDPFAK
jgi:2-dehydropantoate 2-reductase